MCDIETAIPAPAAPAAAGKRRSMVATAAACTLGALALFAFTATQGSEAAQVLSGRRSLLAEQRELGAGGIQWGATTGAMNLDARQGQFGGKYIDNALLYSTVDNMNDNWWKWNAASVLNKGHGVVITMEFTKGNLQTVLSGEYDGVLKNLGRIIGQDGREVWLRPFHEFNGDWYAWGAFKGHNGNSQDSFKAAYRHVVETIRGAGGGNAKFQLAYNNENPQDDKSQSFGSYYPGGDVVDMLVASAYNRCGTDGWHTTQDSFDTAFGAAYAQMAAVDGSKPIGVAETSSTDYCGDKAEWFRAAFSSMKDKSKYPRLQQVNWFMENTDGADWGPQSQAQSDVFRDNL